MAKWEDRDNRWIVNDLKDGKNVNSWHWDELDISHKFITDFEISIINNIVKLNSNTKIKITDCKDFDGYIKIINRKNKKKLNYNFSFKIDGILIENGNEQTINMTIPDVYDYEPEIEFSNSNKYQEQISNMISTTIGKFISNYDTDLQLTSNNKKKMLIDYELKYNFKIPKYVIYNSLNSIELMEKYTNSNVNVDGKTIYLYDNNINLEIISTIKNEKMILKLSAQQKIFDVEIYFDDNIDFSSKIRIKHKQRHDSDKYLLQDLWKEKFWIPICKHFDTIYEVIDN